MSMQQDNSGPLRPTVLKRRLWLRIVFGLSLALNLLVLGVAVGAALRFGGPDGARRPPQVVGAALYRELPRDDRRAFRQAMEKSPQARGPSRKAVAGQIAALLRTTPFDMSALQALLDDHAAKRGQWQMAANRALIAQLAQMDPQERAAYADRVEEALSRSGQRVRKHRDRSD